MRGGHRERARRRERERERGCSSGVGWIENPRRSIWRLMIEVAIEAGLQLEKQRGIVRPVPLLSVLVD